VCVCIIYIANVALSESLITRKCNVFGIWRKFDYTETFIFNSQFTLYIISLLQAMLDILVIFANQLYDVNTQDSIMEFSLH
jgi:hypothetical protein